MSRYSVSTFAVGLFSCALTAPDVAFADGRFSFDTIALSGTTGTARGLGPNLGDGVDFASVGPGSINDRGDVVLYGRLAGDGVTSANNQSLHIKSAAGGSLTLLSRTNNNSLSDVTQQLTDYGGFTLNDNGEVHFAAVIGGSRSGYFTNAGAPTHPVAVASVGGDVTPGPNLGPGVHFKSPISSFSRFAFNNAGTVAFPADLVGAVDATNNVGIFTALSGATATPLARTGAAGPGPDIGAGVYYTSFTHFSTVNPPALNDSNQLAFRAVVAGPGVDSTNDKALLVKTIGGTTRVAARTGSVGPTPDAGAGVYFTDFELDDSLGFNNAGDVAFRGMVTWTGGSVQSRRGIFVSTGSGTVRTVARGGSIGTPVSPGLGDDLVFNVFLDPVINSAGKTAFVAQLTGPGADLTPKGYALYTDAGGALANVARSGEPAPVESSGGSPAVFGAFPRAYSLNARSDLAFLNILEGADVTAANDRALFAYTGGNLLAVVREGDLFDVDPGPGFDNRTILTVGGPGMTGGEDGKSRSLNDSGTLVFSLQFTDGSSGVFSAAVPEPAVWSLAVLGSLPALLRGRRVRTKAHT